MAMLLLEEILSSWTEQEAGAGPGAAVRRLARAARHRHGSQEGLWLRHCSKCEGLYKHFGGVVATDHLDLAVAAGRVHALIGPNGAGKTTLVAQICGEVEPDSGQVLFDGGDISALRAHERVAAGLARSFQITRIFGNLAVRDNIALAVQARSGSSMRFWDPVASVRELNEEIDALVEELGLADIRSQRAASLPHAGQRRFEAGAGARLSAAPAAARRAARRDGRRGSRGDDRAHRAAEGPGDDPARRA